MPTPAEVFLSHATPDRRFADRLSETLRDHGIPTWYSRTNLVGTQQWHNEIGAALDRCDAFAIVLSPAALASHWVQYELVYALNEPRLFGRIAPLLLRPCEPKRLSFALQSIQRVDFTAGFDAGCTGLLRAWGLGYKGPPGPPPPKAPAAPRRKSSRPR